MATITSKHDAPLALPNGPTLRPGIPTHVKRWDVIKGSDVVRSWLRADLLDVSSVAVATVDAPDLEGLKAQAKELGIAVHYRWSAEKIQEEIDKKLAE